MRDNKYTLTIKDAEEGTKLRTVQAKLKDELIRVHLHNDNHDESKEQSCLRHCSCNRVHQTPESIYEKQDSMLLLLVTSVQSKFKLPSQIAVRWITDIQLYKDYKSHAADCEICCSRDRRRNNRGREIIYPSHKYRYPFEIFIWCILSQKKTCTNQELDWLNSNMMIDPAPTH